MDKEQIDIEELYDECLLIYDYDVLALFTHVAYLLERGRKTKDSFKKQKYLNLTKIREDFEEVRNLEKYRIPFIKIMDSLNSEIELFKKLSKFDLKGYSGTLNMLLIFSKEKEVKEKLTDKKKKELEQELVDIIYYAQQIIENLDKE
jgi:hypothetical protein